MRTPVISIVLPIYNGELYLREALASIAGQSLEDWELLVGDDKSSDASLRIVAQFSNGDPRVRVVTNVRRRGIFGNLNDLIGRARAECIKIFCQDDVMHPHCLERQIAFMLAHPDIAFCRVLQLDRDSKAFAEQDEGIRSLPSVIKPAAAALAFFVHGNIPGNLSNVMLRRAAWKQARGFREDLPYAGDMEFWFRLARQHPFGVVPERLNFVRAHEGQASVTLNRKNELVEQVDVVLDGIFSALPARTKARLGTRLWGSINYAAQAIHRGVRLGLSGRKPNLHALARRRAYAFSLPLSVLLYVVTGNRRWGMRRVRAPLEADLKEMLA